MTGCDLAESLGKLGDLVAKLEGSDAAGIYFAEAKKIESELSQK